MAVKILGLGLPHTSSLVPKERAEALGQVLALMESDMNSSPYDWEMYYVEPDMDFDLLIKKLHENEWDVVMVGMGLRIGSQVGVFFEKIINAVHKELPKAKFAFNTSIESTREACDRVLGV